jgi:hypothetical protein
MRRKLVLPEPGYNEVEEVMPPIYRALIATFIAIADLLSRDKYV